MQKQAAKPQKCQAITAIYRALVSTLLLLVLIAACKAENQINEHGTHFLWGVIPNQEPLFILQGDKKGEGLGDLLYKTLQSKLPEYEHALFHAQFLRLLAEVAAGKQFCTIMAKAPERSTKFTFSKRPIVLTPAPRLIVVREKLEAFRRQTGWNYGPIALDEILQMNPDLRLGILHGRTYGNKIDAILNNSDPMKNRLYRHSGFSGSQGLLRMQLAGRVDASFESLWQIGPTPDRDEKRVLTIPIAKLPKYIELYIGCPKTTWGEQAIDRINTAAQKSRRSLRDIPEPWMRREEILAYRKKYDQLYHWKQ